MDSPFLVDFLENERSLILIFAAGLAASAAAALTEFGVAQAIQEKYPHASEILNAFGFTQLFNEIVYGILAIGPERFNPGNDLVYLWQEGEIHPLIPMAIVILLPLIQRWALKRLIFPSSLSAASLQSPQLHR